MKSKESKETENSNRFGEKSLPEWEKIGHYKLSKSEMYRYGFTENPTLWGKIKERIFNILPTYHKNGGEK